MHGFLNENVVSILWLNPWEFAQLGLAALEVFALALAFAYETRFLDVPLTVQPARCSPGAVPTVSVYSSEEHNLPVRIVGPSCGGGVTVVLNGQLVFPQMTLMND